MDDNKMKGLGDLIAKATKAVGIKPCGGCKKRQELFNKAVPFGRREQPAQVPQPIINKTATGPRTEWVDGKVPDGWHLVQPPCVSEKKTVSLYTNGDAFVIWDIVDGKYRNSHTFCCGTNDKAYGAFIKRCRQ